MMSCLSIDPIDRIVIEKFVEKEFFSQSDFEWEEKFIRS
jgi:hypothetical protein